MCLDLISLLILKSKMAKKDTKHNRNSLNIEKITDKRVEFFNNT